MLTIDKALKSGQQAALDRERGQLNFFGFIDELKDESESVDTGLPDVEEWSEKERAAFEKETLGYYVTAHPLGEYAETLFLDRARMVDPDYSSILVEKADMHALPDMLKRGRYDAIITAYHERDQLNSSEFVWRLIEFTKLAFFIPEGHPLYDKETLCLEDFRPYSFVTMDPLTNTGYYDMFLSACHSWGFEPRIASTVLNASSMRFSLETGQHVVCGDSVICQWENDHIRKFEVDVPNISGLIVAWRKSSEDEYLLEFADAMLG